MATTNKGLNQPAFDSPGWNSPLNDNFGYIDAALGGTTTKNVTGVGTTPMTLTLSEYQALVLNFTGTLTANVTYQVPSGIGGQWIVANNTTGAYTLTFRTAAVGASVVIPTGSRRMLYSDGTNIYTSDTSIGNVGEAGRIAFSDGVGLTGSANLTYDGTRFKVALDDATNNGVSAPIRLAHTTSGTAAAGIGTGIELETEIPAGTTLVGGSIYAVMTDATAGSEDYELQFRLMANGAAAATVAKITSTQILIGSDFVLTSRTNAGTAAQNIAYAGIISTSADDGSKSSGTYTPAPAGGNFKTISNAGAFTLAAPSVAGSYTMIVEITNVTGAGAITLSGFTKTTGSPFTTTVGHKFCVSITKGSNFTYANVVALQ